MRQVQTNDAWDSPNFQALHPNGRFLYSVASEQYSEGTDHGTVVAYRIDQDTGTLTQISARSTEGAGPAHVSIDPHGRFAYVSNYRAGGLSVYRIRGDGTLSEAVYVVEHEGSSVDEQRQTAPHVHSAVPSADGRFLYVSDLGIDRIMIYRVNGETGELRLAEQPYYENTPGSGPRHFTIHPNNKFAYSLEEMSSTIVVLESDSSSGALTQIQRISMLPEAFEGDNTAADLHISPDGRFLYASNRGHDSLVIYRIDRETGELSVVGHESTRGPHPRNFMIDKQGEFLLVANRDENEVVIFRRDRESGQLTFTGEEVEVPRAVCVTQLFLD
jgi:6-phosphogluconolactonase